MGRRMKISEKFTWSCSRQLVGGPPSAAPSAAGFPDRHAAAGREAQLALGDHGLAELEALVDHQRLIGPDAGRDRTRFHRAVRFDHEHEFSRLPGLDRLVGDHQRIGLRRQPEIDAHELARPELAIGVGEGSLELDRAGGHVHVVIDERQKARFPAGIVVLRDDRDRQLSNRHVLLHHRPIATPAPRR